MSGQAAGKGSEQDSIKVTFTIKRLTEILGNGADQFLFINFSSKADLKFFQDEIGLQNKEYKGRKYAGAAEVNDEKGRYLYKLPMSQIIEECEVRPDSCGVDIEVEFRTERKKCAFYSLFKESIYILESTSRYSSRANLNENSCSLYINGDAFDKKDHFYSAEFSMCRDKSCEKTATPMREFHRDQAAPPPYDPLMDSGAWKPK